MLIAHHKFKSKAINMPSTHVMNNNKYGIRDYDDQEGDLAGLGGPLGGNENKSHPILKSDN